MALLSVHHMHPQPPTFLCISSLVSSHFPTTQPFTMIDTAKLHPAYDPQFMQFPSRRSTVFSAKGMVATSQPLGEAMRDGATCRQLTL